MSWQLCFICYHDFEHPSDLVGLGAVPWVRGAYRNSMARGDNDTREESCAQAGRFGRPWRPLRPLEGGLRRWLESRYSRRRGPHGSGFGSKVYTLLTKMVSCTPGGPPLMPDVDPQRSSPLGPLRIKVCSAGKLTAKSRHLTLGHVAVRYTSFEKAGATAIADRVFSRVFPGANKRAERRPLPSNLLETAMLATRWGSSIGSSARERQIPTEDRRQLRVAAA